MSMRKYSIRLKFELMMKDLYFQIGDEEGADGKWKKACEDLEKVANDCSSAPEFFEKAMTHFAELGFQHIAK